MKGEAVKEFPAGTTPVTEYHNVETDQKTSNSTCKAVCSQYKG